MYENRLLSRLLGFRKAIIIGGRRKLRIEEANDF